MTCSSSGLHSRGTSWVTSSGGKSHQRSFKRSPMSSSDSLQVRVTEDREQLGQLLRWEVPPADLLQKLDELVVKAHFDEPGRVAADDAVGFKALGYHRLRRYNATVPQVDAGHHGAFPANPHIIADDDVPFKGEL